ncbi:MAG: SagB/ThcOx family dehydrogenase [Theionarchaea archaeon]|nr:SagB/ThcOx family dehydrogenase [Theionarchaea archaeon]
MKERIWILMVFCLCLQQPSSGGNTSLVPQQSDSHIILPPPLVEGDMSVEEAIRLRRSVRDFSDHSLTISHISQLLWSGQGITEAFKRAAPSAGATYPLTLYLIVGEGGVEGIPHGIYEYIPDSHSLICMKEGDFRSGIASACLNQTFIAKAPVSIVIAADYERTTRRYGERGIRYVHMEAGHVGENIYLQAVALHLGTVVVGAFQDDELHHVLGLPVEEVPLYVMPVGFPGK